MFYIYNTTLILFIPIVERARSFMSLNERMTLRRI